jgi:uncharacterized membrane protein YidH (DUF202 family)
MENDKKNLHKLEAHLSNERTLLSYIRTSSAVLVLSVALFKFFEDRTVIMLGFFTLIFGACILILGIYRFFQERRRIYHQRA